MIMTVLGGNDKLVFLHAKCIMCIAYHLKQCMSMMNRGVGDVSDKLDSVQSLVYISAYGDGQLCIAKTGRLA